MKFQNNQRGSILVVMVVAIVLGMMAMSVGLKMAIHSQAFSRVFAKSKTNFEAEGILKLMERISQLYFQTNIVYSNAALTAFIAPYIATIQPANYNIVDWRVDIGSASAIGAIRSGPFRGMQADSHIVKYWITLKELATGVKTSVYVEGEISAITFTQFAGFSFGDFNSWSGVNSLLLNGRVHTNKNFCGGGNPEMDILYLSAVGLINHLNSAGAPCGPTYGYILQVKISNGAIDVPLIPNATSGCLNCDGSGMAWADYALSRWNGHVQDKSFSVPALKLPTTSLPLVQNIYRFGDPIGINQAERFLVDPVRAADAPDIVGLKIATKADIRIINGVWYLKNLVLPNDWPGIPIWSDHPGSFTTTDEEGVEGFHNVGQEDIRTSFIARYGAALATRWVGGETPKKFSYYEFNTALNQMNDNAEGIVSYGNLYRQALDQWLPGFYAKNIGVSNSLCQPAVLCNDISCTGQPNLIRNFNSPLSCANGVNPSRAARLLNSTRSGFRFGMWMVATVPAAEGNAKSKILPMNIDIQALQNALSCNFNPATPADIAKTHPGELGCYFTSWGLMHREFNGIIYITNTWKGQMQGFGIGHAGRQPHMQNTLDASFAPGTNTDINQIAVSHPAQHSALPFELCSTSLAGQNFDANGLFKIPNCVQYNLLVAGANKLRTRPSDIRIINAKDLDHTILTHGLSIVSNINVFLQGDVNTNSDTTTAIAAPWTPLLVGANNILLHSKNWSDDNDRWDVLPASLVGLRTAETTQYNLALITSQFPFFMNENWVGKTTIVRSPLLLFYDPAFDNMGAFGTTGTTTFDPGNFDMKYDSHFEYLANQPPGLPFMNVFSTNGWLIK